MSVKAITVRFHLDHPAEKQAWEKLLSLQTERHLSFSQAVTDALNACGTDTSGLPNADKDQLVQDITDAMALRLQQMLPAYLAGYTAGANGTATALVAQETPVQPALHPAPVPYETQSDDIDPDFDNSCMDFHFIGS